MTQAQISADVRAFLRDELDTQRARAVRLLDDADDYARVVLAEHIANLDRVRANPPEVVLRLAAQLQRVRSEVTP